MKLKTLEWIQIRIIELEQVKAEMFESGKTKEVKYKTLEAELNTLHRILRMEVEYK